MIWRAVPCALALVLATPAIGQETGGAFDGNPEMQALFAADQEERTGEAVDWAALRKADRERRARVRELLDRGELQTADDFYAAAFVFQHGNEPEAYLLAHALAVRSLALGHENAESIAAASLDRYLQSIAREQIYGTQSTRYPGEDATRGRYDRDLLTDQLRVAAGTGTLAEQDAKLDKQNAPAGEPE